MLIVVAYVASFIVLAKVESVTLAANSRTNVVGQTITVRYFSSSPICNKVGYVAFYPCHAPFFASDSELADVLDKGEAATNGSSRGRFWVRDISRFRAMGLLLGE